MSNKGHTKDAQALTSHDNGAHFDTFVLDKGIFSSVFEKDIKRVYVYKKAERLAKAIHLVAPAFRNSPSLKDRLDGVAVTLIDAAILHPSASREALSRELLALSSLLSIARTGGFLSPMNADLIAREAHLLLQEVAAYQEPRLFLDDAPSLAALAKSSSTPRARVTPEAITNTQESKGQSKGHISDTAGKNDRRDAILAVLRSRGPSYIKDISTVIRDVSEKTIQRELSALVTDGAITRNGERRWTTYALAL